MPNKTSTGTIVELQDVRKSFNLGAQEVEIVKGVSFKIVDGDFAIIFGPSGCGKSTILNMLLGLEPPTGGSVQFQGTEIYQFDEDHRSQLRKEKIGMVYQQSNWIKALTVIENVCFPLTLRGIPEEDRIKRGREVLEMVGMAQGEHQHPWELSSGQQQRVSLARALIADPVLLVADEPTGNLDSKASEEIMELFGRLNSEGKTVIMVTHDLEYLRYASRSINVSDGKILAEYGKNDPKLKSLSVSKRGAELGEAVV